MARAKNPPANWSIVSTGSSPVGDICKWRNDETDAEVTLPVGQMPDDKTLWLLQMNYGAESSGITFSGDVSTLPEDSEPLQETAVDRVLTALQSRGDADGRSEIKVYKLYADGKESYCGLFTAEEFEARNLELIRAKFGAGKFRVMVYGTMPKVDAQGQAIKGGGRFVRLANQVFEIEPSLEPLRPNDSSVSTSMNPVMEQLLQQNRELIARVESGPKPQTLEEQLKTFILMKQAFGNTEHPKSPIEMLKEMRELMDVTKDLTPEKPEVDTGIIGMGKQLMDMIGPAITANRNPQPHAQPQPLPLVALPETFSTAAQPAPAEIPQGDDVNAIQTLAVNAMIKSLVKAASENQPVEPHINFLYEKLPQEIIDVMKLPTWFDVLSEMYPQFIPHREWLTRVRDGILVMIAEDEAADAEAQTDTPADD